MRPGHLPAHCAAVLALCREGFARAAGPALREVPERQPGDPLRREPEDTLP